MLQPPVHKITIYAPKIFFFTVLLTKQGIYVHTTNQRESGHQKSSKFFFPLHYHDQYTFDEKKDDIYIEVSIFQRQNQRLRTDS
jgi:hypothetical protein